MRSSRVLLVVAAAGVAGLAWLLLHGDRATLPSGSILSRDAGASRGPAPVFPVPQGAEPGALPLPSVGGDEPAASSDEGARSVAAAPSAEPTTIITGRIVGPAGDPIAGADVLFGSSRSNLWRVHWDFVIHGAGAVTPHAVSGPDGRFTLGVIVGPGAGEPSSDRAPRLVFLHPDHAVTLGRCDSLPAGAFAVGDVVLGPGAVIEGRVVAASGGPIGGADVSVANAVPDAGADLTSGRFDEEIRQWFLGRRTTTDGEFRCTGLRPGGAALTAASEGLASTTQGGLLVAEAAPLDVGDVVLGAGASIAGVVVDAKGGPLSGAAVQIELAPDTRRASPPPASAAGSPGLTRSRALSGTDGRFEAGGLAPGVYDVHASLTDHAWSRVFDVPTGTTDLHVTMSLLGSILLTVEDAIDGQPIVGAEVGAQLPASERYQPWSNGQFHIASGEEAPLPPGEYRVSGAGPEGTELTVRAEGHVGWTAVASGVGPAETATLTIRLARTVRIVGIVTDDAGVPVAGAAVGATSKSLQLGSESALCDAHGEFRLGVPAAGDWDVSTRAPGLAQPVPVRVSVPPGGLEHPVRIVMLRAGSIAGTIFDADERPVAAAPVLAALRGDPGVSWQVRLSALGEKGAPRTSMHVAMSDAAGRYSFPELDAGRYAVWTARGGEIDVRLAALWCTTPEDEWASQVGYASVDPARTAHLDLHEPRPGAIHGRVTADGVAAPRCIVAVSLADIDYPALSMTIATQVQTDELGDFAVPELRPADYLVLALVDGAPVPRLQRVRVAPGDSTLSDFDIRGPRATGTVVDDVSGSPIAGVDVRVGVAIDEAGNGPAGEKVWPRSFDNVADTMFRGSGRAPFVTTTDGAGRFVLRCLEPGRYKLWMRGGGYLPASTTFDVTGATGPGDMVVKMMRGAVIEGTVQPQGLSPLPRVTACLIANEPDGPRRLDSTQVREGHFRFDSIAPGPYTVTICRESDMDSPLGSRSVSLKAAQVASIVVVVGL